MGRVCRLRSAVLSRCLCLCPPGWTGVTGLLGLSCSSPVLCRGQPAFCPEDTVRDSIKSSPKMQKTHVHWWVTSS